MITHLGAHNFEHITDADLDLGPLTLIYGPNGAGKSSLLNALAYLVEGRSPRHERVGGVIRQGSDGASVVLTIGDVDYSRVRDSRSAVCSINAEVVPERTKLVDGRPSVGFVESLEKALGCSAAAFAASLRSGALLHLKSEELQKFLQVLTGASFDAPAIASALPAEAKKALAWQKLAVPTSLVELRAAAQKAVEARIAAKNDRKSLVAQGDLLPSFGPELVAEAGGIKPAALQEKLAARQQERANALATRSQDEGAATERLRQLRARADELRAVPKVEKPNLAKAERARDEAANLKAGIERDIASQERALAAAQREAAGDTTLPPDADSLPGRLECADEVLRVNREQLATIAAEGKRLKSLLESLQGAGAHCPTCTQAIGAELLEAVRGNYESVGKAWKTQAAVVQTAERDLAGLQEKDRTRTEILARLAAHGRCRTHESNLDSLRNLLQPATDDLADATSALEKARADWTQAALWDAAARELKGIEQTLAEPPAEPPPPADVNALDTELAHLAVLAQVHATQEKRRTLDKDTARLEDTIRACDLVAEHCGDGGVRVRLLAAAVGPFLAPANEVLATLLPGFSLDVETDGEIGFFARAPGCVVAVDKLSHTQEIFCRAALQIAVARLGGAPLVALDHLGDSDEQHIKALRGLAMKLVNEGLQIILVKAGPAPASITPPIVAYEVKDGRVRRVPDAQKEAA